MKKRTRQVTLVMALALVLAIGILPAMAGTLTVPTRAPSQSPLTTFYDSVAPGAGASTVSQTLGVINQFLTGTGDRDASVVQHDARRPEVALGSGYYDAQMSEATPTTADKSTAIALQTSERTQPGRSTLTTVAKSVEAAGTGDDIAGMAQIVPTAKTPELIAAYIDGTAGTTPKTAAVGDETWTARAAAAGDKAAKGTFYDIALQTGQTTDVKIVAAMGKDTKGAQGAADSTTHQVIASGMYPCASGRGSDAAALDTGGAQIVRIAKALTGEIHVAQTVLPIAA